MEVAVQVTATLGAMQPDDASLFLQTSSFEEVRAHPPFLDTVVR